MAVLAVPEDILRQAFDMIVAQYPAEVWPGTKTFHINGGCNMRGLNEVHGRVEDWANNGKFIGMLDDVIGSAEHYFFACVHDALRNLTVLRIGDLDFEAFCSRFDSHPNYRVLKTQRP